MIRTKPTLAVAEVMLGNPGGRFYGYNLWQITGVRFGTLYPMLARFERDGLVRSQWQAPEDMGAKQIMPRRYYVLTDMGRAELSALISTERP